MDLVFETKNMPTPSIYIVRTELMECTGTTPERLDELVEMGWIVPTRTADEAMLFRRIDVYRLRKLERLCTDFDLHTVGGTIVVDLLERVEELEQRLQTLTRL